MGAWLNGANLHFCTASCTYLSVLFLLTVVIAPSCKTHRCSVTGMDGLKKRGEMEKEEIKGFGGWLAQR